MPLRHLIVLIADGHSKGQALEMVTTISDPHPRQSCGSGKTSFTRSARLRAVRRHKHGDTGLAARYRVPVNRNPNKSSLHDVDRTGALAVRPVRKLFSIGGNSLSMAAMARPPLDQHGWWSRTGSNRRPPECKSGALPTELRPRIVGTSSWSDSPKGKGLVGLDRLELSTSPLSGVRSNHLSYRPQSRGAVTVTPRG